MRKKNKSRVKSQIILPIIILLLVGCQNNQSINNENFEANKWFDKFGNEFKFENSKLETKPYLGQIWWEIGRFEIQNKSLVLTCEQDSTKKYITKIISIKEDKIVFDKPIDICYSLISENEQKREFELWRDLELIKDKEEKISSIKFKVKPQPEFLGKIRNFNLKKDKKVEISFKDEESIDTIYFLNDSIFSNIENLIQILPIEEYNEEYEFAIMHNANYDIELVTNKVSKKINCKGFLPRGLNNLIQYINFEME